MGIRSDESVEVEQLKQDVMAYIHRRGYNNDLLVRGCQLHLEASELIESLRGKGDSAVCDEAADVLFNLLALLDIAQVPWTDVVASLQKRVGSCRTPS